MACVMVLGRLEEGGRSRDCRLGLTLARTTGKAVKMGQGYLSEKE